MARIVLSTGRKADWPQIEVAQVASAAAGSAADVSTLICALPDPKLWDLPTNIPPSGTGGQSMEGINNSRLRQIYWVNNAANRAGNATNNYDFQLRLYRAGVLQGILAYNTQSISTTVAAAVTATGIQAVTPAAMTGIVPGQPLYIDSAGTPELVYVQSVTATTFTANFTKTHSASFTATSEALLNWGVAFVIAKATSGLTSATTITAGAGVVVTPNTLNGLNGMYGIHVNDWLYISGGTGTAEYVQVTAVAATTFTATYANNHSGAYTIQTAGNPNNPGGTGYTPNSGNGDSFEIKAGDVLTLTRVSNNVTGLAQDAGILQFEWVPARIGRD